MTSAKPQQVTGLGLWYTKQIGYDKLRQLKKQLFAKPGMNQPDQTKTVIPPEYADILKSQI